MSETSHQQPYRVFNAGVDFLFLGNSVYGEQKQKGKIYQALWESALPTSFPSIALPGGCMVTVNCREAGGCLEESG